MSWQPKRLYVYQANSEFRVSENLADLATMGKELIVGVYELVGSGSLRCEPTLNLNTPGPLDAPGDMAIGGTE